MTTTSENDMQQIYVPKTARARGQKLYDRDSCENKNCRVQWNLYKKGF